MAYQWCSYNGKIVSSPSGKTLGKEGLPPISTERTYRFKFLNAKPSFVPKITPHPNGSVYEYTWRPVRAAEGIWDCDCTMKPAYLYVSDYLFLGAIDGHKAILIDYNDTYGKITAEGMFRSCSSLVSICHIDTTVFSNMHGMFKGCSSLEVAPQIDTSNATNLEEFLYECSSLTSVPLYNTSKVSNATRMLASCYKIESGALALYQQMSTQTTPPSKHYDTFKDCGRDTVTGAAELAQIPSSWGGLAT